MVYERLGWGGVGGFPQVGMDYYREVLGLSDSNYRLVILPLPLCGDLRFVALGENRVNTLGQ
jgi:hypothetical protein